MVGESGESGAALLDLDDDLRHFFGELEERGVLVVRRVGGSCARCCCWMDGSRTIIIVRGHFDILAVIVAIGRKAITVPVWCRC